MDESKPLDLFLQPSRRLIVFSLFFILCCAIFVLVIPLSWQYKLLLAALMLVGITLELWRSVLLLSSSSIIRIGYDGGIMDTNGHVSDISWWYQRRAGEKVYAPLSSASRVWVEWVALDFSRWPWQFGRTVVIARDSVEDPKEFQRLKRVLRR